MKKTIVKVTPEMVATFLVSTLMTASANSATVINIRPTGISVLPMWKFSGTFHSRAPGCL